MFVSKVKYDGKEFYSVSKNYCSLPTPIDRVLHFNYFNRNNILSNFTQQVMSSGWYKSILNVESKDVEKLVPIEFVFENTKCLKAHKVAW